MWISSPVATANASESTSLPWQWWTFLHCENVTIERSPAPIGIQDACQAQALARTTTWRFAFIAIVAPTNWLSKSMPMHSRFPLVMHTKFVVDNFRSFFFGHHNVCNVATSLSRALDMQMRRLSLSNGWQQHHCLIHRRVDVHWLLRWQR